jgi:hypothetical protein
MELTMTSLTSTAGERSSNVRFLLTKPAPTFECALRLWRQMQSALAVANMTGDDTEFNRVGDLWDDAVENTIEHGDEVDRLKAFTMWVAELGTDDPPRDPWRAGCSVYRSEKGAPRT